MFEISVLLKVVIDSDRRAKSNKGVVFEFYLLAGGGGGLRVRWEKRRAQRI